MARSRTSTATLATTTYPETPSIWRTSNKLSSRRESRPCSSPRVTCMWQACIKDWSHSLPFDSFRFPRHHLRLGQRSRRVHDGQLQVWGQGPHGSPAAAPAEQAHHRHVSTDIYTKLVIGCVSHLLSLSPSLFSEYWPGWFDHWFAPIHIILSLESFESILQAGFHFTMTLSINLGAHACTNARNFVQGCLR